MTPTQAGGEQARADEEAAEGYAVTVSKRSYHCPCCGEDSCWPLGKEDFLAGIHHERSRAEAEIAGLKEKVHRYESFNWAKFNDNQWNELEAERDALHAQLAVAVEALTLVRSILANTPVAAANLGGMAAMQRIDEALAQLHPAQEGKT